MGRLLLLFISSLVIFAAYGLRILSQNEYVLPEMAYSVGELVNSHGYQFEYHSVTTNDGYILELHRIQSANPNSTKPPIFIMHGLTASSITHLSVGDAALPYYLAQNGYDVWLGNSRGNAYSRKHVSLDPDVNAKEFFDFSWHEIGAIDLPAMIDYVLTLTNKQKLFYTGHSQGTISFYVMMSEHPEYNDKVELMLALAPVVYTKGIRSLAFRVPALVQSLFEWITAVLGIHEIVPRSDTWTAIGNTFCRDGALTQKLCYLPFGVAGGFNYPGLNFTRFPLILTHYPSGSATKQLLHYTQVLNSDILRQYDHGKNKNLQKYGQLTPPLYHLSKTTVPVAIFWSENDWFTSKRNIDLLSKELPNVIQIYTVPDRKFNHFDFTMSYTAQELVNIEFLRVMEDHLDAMYS